MGQAASLGHPLTPFVDKLVVPVRRVVTGPTRLAVRLETAMHRFHRDLPPSRVWTYDGSLPGPTIEVGRGVALEVQWENRLSGSLPVIVTVAPEYAVDGVPVQCTPGRSGGRPDPAAAALPGFSVVHLHGGMTYATSDGWTENLAMPGQQALDSYPNDQRGTMLWYHDHVMGVTRFSVYAGLAGPGSCATSASESSSCPRDRRTRCRFCWPTATSTPARTARSPAICCTRRIPR